LSETQTSEFNEDNSVTLLESLVIELFKRGSIVGFIEGRRKSGKTNIALLIAEIAAYFHLIDLFATNIKVLESKFPIDYWDNMEDLVSWCHNQKGTKLFLLDEAGKAIRRRTPMSKQNIQWLDEFQVLRHDDLSVLMMAPDETYMDRTSLGTDVLDIRIRKPYFDNPKIALWIDLLENHSITLTGIPETSIKYDDKWVSSFNKTGSSHTPKFSDTDQQLIWDWSHGKTIKELGIHHMKINRILKKFVTEVLEKEQHAAHS
jgi:hypothetical protein